MGFGTHILTFFLLFRFLWLSSLYSPIGSNLISHKLELNKCLSLRPVKDGRGPGEIKSRGRLGRTEGAYLVRPCGSTGAGREMTRANSRSGHWWKGYTAFLCFFFFNHFFLPPVLLSNAANVGESVRNKRRKTAAINCYDERNREIAPLQQPGSLLTFVPCRLITLSATPPSPTTPFNH